MPKIKYVEKKFQFPSRKIIDQANSIITEFSEQGFDLTLRQLYYQFVSKGLIANTERDYKRLGNIINDARLAGLVDWHSIVDRTRELKSLTYWESPKEIIESSIRYYRIDRWEKQPYRVEVWIEKDALTGVISGICRDMFVSYFSCRGYVSQSEMWEAAQRLYRYNQKGQECVILHLGDHDPSGIDMTRDIMDRLETFKTPCVIKRIALTMEQIEENNPPPNPAKITDSRYEGYLKKYGSESWELDAINPNMLTNLIREKVLFYRDQHTWEEAARDERNQKDKLRSLIKEF